jgi:Putative Flp pilus-assembly TadE/G-like
MASSHAYMAEGDRGDAAQAGAVLPLMAIMLVVLMGTAAMAIDLGWLFWQSIEIQHGADSAALAGVVYEPIQRTNAHEQAEAAAKENGYDDTSPDTTVTVLDLVDDPTAVEHDLQLRVTITQRVDTFFMQIFGLDHFDLERTAVAEYAAPLNLGSPTSYFGDDPAQQIYDTGLYAAITGNYVPKAWGDRHSLCLDFGQGAECREQGDDPPYGGAPQGYNPEGVQSVNWGTTAAEGGYVFGIDVPEGSSGLKVEIFDAPLYSIRRNYSSPTPPTGAGNFFDDTWYNPGPNGWNYTVEATTWYMLYGPDPTPGDSTDGNELLCSLAFEDRLPSVNPNDNAPPNSSSYLGDFGSMGWDMSWLEFDQVRAAGHQDILNAMWQDMAGSTIADYASPGCSSSFDRGPGTYLLRVMNEYDDSGEADTRLSWVGLNMFSLRTSTAVGAQPTIAGVGEMLMHVARNTPLSEFYLAEVPERYAGRDLTIEFWDVGDISGGAASDNLSIIDGTGSVVDCEWSATNGDSGSGPCSIITSGYAFDNELITVTIALPDDYTCTGLQCWFKAHYTYGGGWVRDTSTWAAYIEGNPLRITE